MLLRSPKGLQCQKILQNATKGSRTPKFQGMLKKTPKILEKCQSRLKMPKIAEIRIRPNLAIGRSIFSRQSAGHHGSIGALPLFLVDWTTRLHCSARPLVVATSSLDLTAHRRYSTTRLTP